MHAASFPEDSTLKRHFESTVEMKRQRWLQIPPSDSILRRHILSQRNQSASTSDHATVAKRSASVVSIGSSTRVEEKPKGFLARFFSLFSKN